MAGGSAGLQSIVRGAVVLADCPARLTDDERRVRIRVTAAGVSAWRDEEADPAWMSTVAGAATLRLERAGPPGPVEAMILERAAGAARAVLDRTRGRAPAADPAGGGLLAFVRQEERKLHLAAPAYAIALPDEVRVVSGPLPAAPWMLTTLHTMAMSNSLSTAATALRVHHSTLQDRITHAEHLPGWNVREPQGRLRLQLALALRRLHRHGP